MFLPKLMQTNIKKDNHSMASMFDKIAPSYDKTNTLMSLGLDSHWRRQLTKQVETSNHPIILDIATGTGAIPKCILKEEPNAKIYGIDISEEMLHIGNNKTSASYILSSAERLPFKDNSFDYVLCCYTLRNIDDLDILLKETKRVLKPNGAFIALDLTMPRNRLLRTFHKIYINKIIPFIGKHISNDKEAYSYLSNSIKLFGDGEQVSQIMKENNYNNIKIKRLSFGIATIFQGRKPI